MPWAYWFTPKNTIKPDYETLFLIYEYTETTLYLQIKNRKKKKKSFNAGQIWKILREILEGLCHFKDKLMFYRNT